MSILALSRWWSHIQISGVRIQAHDQFMQVALTADTRCWNRLFSPLLPVRYHIFLACFVQVRFNFASVSLDDHMPRVVDASSLQAMWSCSGCLPSLIALVSLDTVYFTAPVQHPSEAQLTYDPLHYANTLLFSIFISPTPFFSLRVTPLNPAPVAFLHLSPVPSQPASQCFAECWLSQRQASLVACPQRK